MNAQKALHNEYNRIMDNCKYYEKNGKTKALLNEIGALRGICYALSIFDYDEVFKNDADFSHFIAIQQEYKEGLK